MSAGVLTGAAASANGIAHNDDGRRTLPLGTGLSYGDSTLLYSPASTRPSPTKP
jgi:hypothetical protein